MIKYSCTLSAAALVLSGCGEAPSDTDAAAGADNLAAMATVRTCEGIRADVISIAAGHGVNIVKIYDPVVVKNEPKKISCRGRALVSSGQEATIYYRDTQDADGDWLVQYAEQPLE
jgi:hypothetical protein